MKELNKKQKIIVITISAILLGAIIYYVYGKETPNINRNEIIPYEYETNEIEEKNTTVLENKMEENTEKIIIYITGAVKKEGVYELEEGSRISDAIEQAEGLKEEANTENINLAYKLEDGTKIKIPTQKETQENLKNNIQNNEYITTNSGLENENISNNENIINSTQTKKEQKININKATQEELETLSGIGPSTANKIIQYRKENGNFKSIEEIKNVNGIGESKYDEIKNKIVVKEQKRALITLALIRTF